MQLINTIEISPYNFGNKEYELPGASTDELPEEWNQFWKKCISDKNLGHLDSIRKGSYFVDMQTIHEEDLVEILKNELKDVELSEFEEQVAKINGGIALKHEDVLYIEPMCCSDIGNINEWATIVTSESNTWHQLWIGHPWVYYKKSDNNIEFSNYTEAGPEEINETEPLITVHPSELQSELNKIQEHQRAFESKIQRTLEKMGIANAERISKLMTGSA